MTSTLKPFRSIEPVEGHAVNSIEYNKTGSLVLLTTGNMQARIYDRDGFLVYVVVWSYRRQQGAVAPLTH
jgi:hypothetical protein